MLEITSVPCSFFIFFYWRIHTPVSIGYCCVWNNVKQYYNVIQCNTVMQHQWSHATKWHSRPTIHNQWQYKLIKQNSKSSLYVSVFQNKLWRKEKPANNKAIKLKVMTVWGNCPLTVRRQTFVKCTKKGVLSHITKYIYYSIHIKYSKDLRKTVHTFLFPYTFLLTYFDKGYVTWTHSKPGIRVHWT